MSTLRALPDGERAELERELAALARTAALGDLAADVAHDLANALFGVLGLVDLLLEDATAGSEEAGRLRLLHETALGLKGSVRALLGFARPVDGEPQSADPGAAVADALALLRHGTGRLLDVDVRRPAETPALALPPSQLVQAVLHLVLAARSGGERIVVEISEGTIRVSPPGAETLGVAVAARIAADHGGSVVRDGHALTLALPPV